MKHATLALTAVIGFAAGFVLWAGLVAYLILTFRPLSPGLQ